tara:strand:- start:149 stop:448 length:300 start_codon:yes stop_codon:yes gene_type:complete
MKYQTALRSADELLLKADYSNVVGDRGFEPKNPPSGPTLYPLRDDALPSYANHRVFYQTTEMQKAVTFFNVTAFLYVVGDRGFEPLTLWSQTRCATKLR